MTKRVIEREQSIMGKNFFIFKVNTVEKVLVVGLGCYANVLTRALVSSCRLYSYAGLADNQSVIYLYRTLFLSPAHNRYVSIRMYLSISFDTESIRF